MQSAEEGRNRNDLHSLENGGAVLKARGCWIQSEWTIWLDFRCRPSRSGVECSHHHMIGAVLSAEWGEHSADASGKRLTVPNTRFSVDGSGFKVPALVMMTREAWTKVRAVNDLV